MPSSFIDPEILSLLRSPSSGKPLREALPEETPFQQKNAPIEKTTDTYLITTDGEELFPIKGEIVSLVIPEK